MLSLRSLSSAVASLACASVVAACGRPVDNTYVVLPADRPDGQFGRDLVAIAKRNALNPREGRSVDNRLGHSLHVVEFYTDWMHFWSQNVELSGDEDPAQCGSYTEPHPDPGQYEMSVQPIAPWVSRKREDELMASLRRDLLSMGYDVRTLPLPCSALSKLYDGRSSK